MGTGVDGTDHPARRHQGVRGLAAATGEAYERLELLRLTVEGMPAALDERLAKLTAQAQQAAQAARGAENAAAGNLAWRMETTAPGTLATLAQCGGSGWEIKVRDKQRACYPFAGSDGKVSGWQVP